MGTFCMRYMDGHYTCSGPYGTRLHNFYYIWEKRDLKPRILVIPSKKDSPNDKPTQKMMRRQNGSIPVSRQKKPQPTHSNSRTKFILNKIHIIFVMLPTITSPFYHMLRHVETNNCSNLASHATSCRYLKFSFHFF